MKQTDPNVFIDEQEEITGCIDFTARIDDYERATPGSINVFFHVPEKLYDAAIIAYGNHERIFEKLCEIEKALTKYLDSKGITPDQNQFQISRDETTSADLSYIIANEKLRHDIAKHGLAPLKKIFRNAVFHAIDTVIPEYSVRTQQGFKNNVARILNERLGADKSLPEPEHEKLIEAVAALVNKFGVKEKFGAQTAKLLTQELMALCEKHITTKNDKSRRQNHE
jgi:hypothetical protein